MREIKLTTPSLATEWTSTCLLEYQWLRATRSPMERSRRVTNGSGPANASMSCVTKHLGRIPHESHITCLVLRRMLRLSVPRLLLALCHLR